MCVCGRSTCRSSNFGLLVFLPPTFHFGQQEGIAGSLFTVKDTTEVKIQNRKQEVLQGGVLFKVLPGIQVYLLRFGRHVNQLTLPERLDAIFCGSDKKGLLVHPGDVDQSPAVVYGAGVDRSSADARLLETLKHQCRKGILNTGTGIRKGGVTHHIVEKSSPHFPFLGRAVSRTFVPADTEE